MARGRWKSSPQNLADEAFSVLINGAKAQRSLSKPELKRRLKDVDIRVHFLKLCMEFDETLRLEKFRKGLRLVVQSIGTTKIAAATGIHRVTLYRMLAKGGNPSLENLMRILSALDLRVWILEREFFERKAKVVRPKDY